MANHVMGEVEVQIGEYTFTLRPRFEAIVEMEARAGCTLTVLVNMVARGNLGMKETAAILYGGILGARDKNEFIPSFEKLGEMIMRHGMLTLFGPCGQLVGAAYSGKPINEIGNKHAKKKEPVANPEPTTIEPEPSK